MKPRGSFATLIAACALSSGAWAEVKLNPLFRDGPGLQQNANVPVRGTAKEGEQVTARFDGQSRTTNRENRRTSEFSGPAYGSDK